MQIPHIINKNTLEEYNPSLESLEFIGEDLRKLIAENFHWDQTQCSNLVDLCVQFIAKNFEKLSHCIDLPPNNKDYLWELISIDLPLEFVVPLIDDEYYWQRRCKGKFGNILIENNLTWKSLFLEKTIWTMIENAEPQYKDEETFDDILKLSSFYIHKLRISQLQSWKPPLTWEKYEIPDIYPIEHIKFDLIFENLSLVQEVDIVFDIKNAFETFSIERFQISVFDCQCLGNALLKLKSLKILRLHRSNIKDEHVRVLVQSLVKNKSIEELDLSHCKIRDQGALCIAKLLEIHPKLKILNLCNNGICEIGGQGIGFALLKENVLEVLNLNLNPLGHVGAMGIMKALVRIDRLVKLSLAGCMFVDETSVRVGDMLKSLIAGLEINRTLKLLDLRQTDILPEQHNKINSFLLKNQTNFEETKTDICLHEEELEVQIINENVVL